MQLPFHENANPYIFENAKFLKKVMTPAEKTLWEYLRARRFHGMKFRRQHPIANFILDFYNHEARLAIELDGEIHANPERQAYDKMRTAELETLGVKVMRFNNNENYT